MVFHWFVAFSIFIVAVGCAKNETPRPEAAKPAAAAATVPEFTHLIAAETEYYTTGPQQGRPPDGRFEAGMLVELLKQAGTYALVRSENGVEAYVAVSSLEKLIATDDPSTP